MNDRAIAARIQEIAESLDPAELDAAYRHGVSLEARDRAEREAWIAPEQADWDSDLENGPALRTNPDPNHEPDGTCPCSFCVGWADALGRDTPNLRPVGGEGR